MRLLLLLLQLIWIRSEVVQGLLRCPGQQRHPTAVVDDAVAAARCMNMLLLSGCGLLGTDV